MMRRRAAAAAVTEAAHHITTMTNSTAMEIAEMECGTSLAEDVWAIVPSSTTAMPSLSPLRVTNSESTGKAAAVSTASVTVEEAWTKIHQLRSRLAADVISDPPSSSSLSSTGFNFPTFISPFERPKVNNDKSTNGSSGTTTTTTPTPNGSYQGMAIPLIYCDQTASQRPVRSIEDYIRSISMPCYANTHTNITYTGSQSTAFVAEARQVVGEATGARITGKASLDTVLFGGNGVTGVVAMLIDCLNLRGLVNEAKKSSDHFNITRPVVFVGPHEHHSNLLPWRESGCEVITISERSTDGMVNLDELERYLRLPQYGTSSGRLRMGAFSAVSNVTGIIAYVDAIAILLHKYGALAFFDYASGAPYVKMNMNPNPVGYSSMGKSDEGGVVAVDPSKDAIYFSPHKCYGGTSTPGVLVIKKHLISQTNPPTISGGGTVFYVNNQSHRFLSNRVERYEGGTPDGIGIQRVGLALLAGRRVADEFERIVQGMDCIDNDDGRGGAVPSRPPKTLLEYECSTYDRVVSELKKHAPNLIMLGCYSHDDERNPSQETTRTSSCVGRHLPIFSFLIRCGKRFLHYNYVCAILNDVFGIQSRGGCQCAGPYSQRLLGLTDRINSTEVPSDSNKQIERALLRSDRPCELLRPGYTRLSLPFKGLREEEVDYVIQALIWVAKHGWALLPQYRCDHRTGEWRHWSRRGKPLGKSERRWLSHYDVLASPRDEPNNSTPPLVIDSATNLSEHMEASRDRLRQAIVNANAILHTTKCDPRFLSEVEKMNTAVGMLGSGGNNDSGGGGVDHTLEDLRWYVYQQEVSQYLRDGMEEVPDTLVDDALLGAIHVRIDGKQRETLSTGDSDKLAPAGDGFPCTETAPIDIEGICTWETTDLIPFREGDHAGEAPCDEIKAGYEAGELGHACEIFSIFRDEWIPISEFIEQYGSRVADAAIVSEEDLASCRKRDLSAMEGSSSSMAICSTYTGAINSMPLSTFPPSTCLLPAVEKREKKKPSRDSLQWGESSAPHIAPSTSSQGVQNGSCVNGVNATTPSSAVVSDMSTCAKLSIKLKKHKGMIKPPPKLMRFITQAMIQWDMIQEGDRLLLGLSGGKDSLSLLHCLLEFQKKLPIKFDIEVCTIDPMTPSFDPSPLIPYVEGLGLKYHYIRDDIVQRATSSGKDGNTVSSLCAFCARMKRGNLYTCARRNNCNKLVLAQHLDDCAESFLMSIMHNGFIRTMKANYKINAGDVSVIRPLVYCRESLMTEFAKSANLPVINENCPACFEEPKERARMKKLLSREETLYPNLYDHIRRALIPVMHDDSTAIMRSYLEETIAKSRKIPEKSKVGKVTSGFNSDDVQPKEARCTITVDVEVSSEASTRLLLSSATEEELVAELARRRADKYKLAGAMRRLPNDSTLPPDETGQMCSLTGGDGMIPCSELME